MCLGIGIGTGRRLRQVVMGVLLSSSGVVMFSSTNVSFEMRCIRAGRFNPPSAGCETWCRRNHPFQTLLSGFFYTRASPAGYEEGLLTCGKCRRRAGFGHIYLRKAIARLSQGVWCYLITAFGNLDRERRCVLRLGWVKASKSVIVAAIL